MGTFIYPAMSSDDIFSLPLCLYVPLHPPTTFRPAAPSLHPPPYGAAAAV